MNVQNVSFGSESLTLQVAKAKDKKIVNLENSDVTEQNKDVFESDKKEVSKSEKKEKKSIFEKIANFVGSMKKVGVNTVEYTKGGAKGTLSFVRDTLATVGTVFVIDKIRQGVKISKEANTNAISEIMPRITKGISKNFTKEGILSTLKSGKGKAAIALGVLVGALGFAKQLYKAKLNANERNAMIDHRYVKTPVVSK